MWFSQKDAQKLFGDYSPPAKRSLTINCLASQFTRMEKSNYSKEELKKDRAIFEEIKVRFNKWRSNMYLCAGLYILVFIIAQ